MYSLFLYDTSLHRDIYTKKELNDYLHEILLIDTQNETYVPSKQFMALITFLGCSPNSQLEVKTEIQTHVTQTISAYGGNSIEKLVCPKCTTKIQQASKLLLNFKQQTIWNSPCCNHKIDVKNINWRRSAAFSQTFIQINNIFPKEAIPSDQLLAALSLFSQSTWNYFYSKQQLF